MTWEDLKFWQSGEWDVIQEKLDDLETRGIQYCPARQNLFAALDATPLATVRVVIMGQDPYPNPRFATGIAFDVPSTEKTIPPTLVQIFNELVDDLHYEFPKKTSLKKWTDQGVLLWNAIPTCEAWRSMSHEAWVEWEELTREVVNTTSEKGCIQVYLGSTARRYVPTSPGEGTAILEYSHPSPTESLNSKTPFKGSRIFSTINQKINEKGLGPVIDWRL